jgi:hypothetical protein
MTERTRFLQGGILEDHERCDGISLVPAVPIADVNPAYPTQSLQMDRAWPEMRSYGIIVVMCLSVER